MSYNHRMVRIEQEAEKEATIRTIDEGKKDAFIKGARFTIELLVRITDVEPMECMLSKDMKKYLNELRLEEVNKFISDMLKFIPENDK